MYLNR